MHGSFLRSLLPGTLQHNPQALQLTLALSSKIASAVRIRATTMTAPL
jgi:hypothetical protein